MKQKQQDWDKVVSDFKKGKVNAFNLLYAHYYRGVYFFAKNMLDGIEDQAKDIVSEAFMHLWLRHKDFDSMPGIRSFLFTTTRNACIDYLRKQERHRRSEKEILYISNDEALYRHIHVETIRAEVFQELYIEINNLPTRCASVFKLSFYKGLNTAQIAEELGIDIKTVRNQRAKAIKLLRSALLKKNLLSPALIGPLLAGPLLEIGCDMCRV